MIDFTLSERDEAMLANAREAALLCRAHARYYDEHEEEFAPSVMPEAETFKPAPLPPEDPERDSPGAVMGMLNTMVQNWGDYTVRLRRGSGGLGNAALAASGTPEQIARFRSMTLAMAITEPGCGSDSKAIQTTAVLDEATNEWVLNGEKIFVTTGCRAEGVVVWATIDKSAGRGGIKSFLVPKGAPGFEVTHKEKKLGIRADDTAAMVFRDCRIPRDYLLGGNEKVSTGGGGFKGVMRTFNMTRPAVGAIGIGIAQAALDLAKEELAKLGVEIDYSAGPVARPAIVQKLIEVEADIEAATLDICHAAWMSGKGLHNNTEASIAKAKGGEVARTATQRCIEILGALGISRDYLLEKWFRDSRITDIYEGTGQIQRLIIARDVLEYSAADLS